MRFIVKLTWVAQCQRSDKCFCPKLEEIKDRWRWRGEKKLCTDLGSCLLNLSGGREAEIEAKGLERS